MQKKIDFERYAVDLTASDAFANYDSERGGLECEYAEFAVNYLHGEITEAWLRMREGFITQAEYQAIEEKLSASIEQIKQAR
jgi:hypothetical protein